MVYFCSAVLRNINKSLAGTGRCLYALRPMKLRWKALMDEDVFNIQIRRYLKNVGVTSQREIECAVREALADGRLKGNEQMKVKVTLDIDKLGLIKVIEGTIGLV